MNKYTNIDEYISNFPINIQEKLMFLRNTIKRVDPDIKETISYGIPTFDLNGKHLVHIGGFKNHISFLPTSSPIEEFREDLKGYKISKGTIQFSLNQDIPEELIEKIVRFRYEEIILST